MDPEERSVPEKVVNDIRLAYELHGPENGTPLVLIQGLSMPLNAWPPAFVERLTDAGHRVLVFDNRDIGKSQTFDAHGTPNLVWAALRQRLHLPVRAPYSLDDMAADTSGLMARVGMESAHVLGVSMGGMIAQLLAIHHPQRVRSLTSVMSTTGNPRLPSPERHVVRQLITRPKTDDLESRIAYSLGMWRTISSPGVEYDMEYVEQRMRAMYERGMTRGGVARQMIAIATAPNRVPLLRKLKTPTLVIHGKDDPLVPLAAGADTAGAIPDARFEVIEGLGHDLPPAFFDRITGLVIDHISTAHGDSQAA